MSALARGPNVKAQEAEKLYYMGMKLVDIAEKLEVPAGTVRRWKSTYQWEEQGGRKKSERSYKKKANVRNQNKKGKEAVADEVKEVMENTNLTDKQRLFCIYYVRCFNATKAYQKAYGVNYQTARAHGYKLLSNEEIAKEIEEMKQDKLNRAFFSESDVFQKYIDIAFVDMTDYTEFGSKKIEVLNPGTGEKEEIAVDYVNVKDSSEIDGTLLSEVSKGKYGVKIKLADRMKALQWLSGHMDMATEKQRAEIALLKARAESGKDAKEEKLDALFERLEDALKDAE